MNNNTLHFETHANCVVRIVTDPEPFNPRKDYDNLGRMVCWHRRYTLGDEQPSEDANDYLLNLLRKAGEDAFVDALDARLDAISVKLLADNPGMSYGSRAYCAAFDLAAKEVYAERTALLAKHYAILPLYLYDHSGITMSTGAFSCPWDSGKVGFVFCSLAQARKNWLLTGNEGWETVIPWHDGKTLTMREAAVSVLTSEVKNYDQYLKGECYGYKVTHNETGEEESCWGFYQDEQPGAKDSYVLEQARATAESLDQAAAKEREEKAHWECRDTAAQQKAIDARKAAQKAAEDAADQRSQNLEDARVLYASMKDKTLTGDAAKLALRLGQVLEWIDQR